MADFSSLQCVIFLFYTNTLVLTLTSYCQLPVPVSSAASAHSLVSLKAYARKDFPGRRDSVPYKRTTSVSTIEIKARSKLDCLRLCVQRPNCRAFTYNRVDQNCRSYSEYIRINSSAIKQGWSYLFVIKGNDHRTGRESNEDANREANEPVNHEVNKPANLDAKEQTNQDAEETNQRGAKYLKKTCPTARGYVLVSQLPLCIILYKEPLDYFDAVLSCVADGARLVKIDSVQKQRGIHRYLVSRNLKDFEKVWIQGTYQNGKWHYSEEDDLSMTYMNLATPEQPLPDFGIRLAMALEDGYWHATQEGERLPYLCEIQINER